MRADAGARGGIGASAIVGNFTDAIGVVRPKFESDKPHGYALKATYSRSLAVSQVRGEQSHPIHDLAPALLTF